MTTPHIKDRAVLFLEAKLGDTNQAVKDQLAKGNIVVRDTKMYVNKAFLVGQAGILEVVDKTLSKTVGKTSFEKGKTDENTAFAVTGIVCRYAPAANSSDVTNQPYSEFMYDYTGALRIPKEVHNSEVEILVGSMKIYEGRLGNLFVNGKEASKNGNAENYLTLKAPKFIQGGEEVQVRVRMPEGLSLTGTATYNHFFQFEFDGAATSKKI